LEPISLSKPSVSVSPDLSVSSTSWFARFGSQAGIAYKIFSYKFSPFSWRVGSLVCMCVSVCVSLCRRTGRERGAWQGRQSKQQKKKRRCPVPFVRLLIDLCFHVSVLGRDGCVFQIFYFPLWHVCSQIWLSPLADKNSRPQHLPHKIPALEQCFFFPTNFVPFWTQKLGRILELFVFLV
jgi:hypothetical protein